MKTEDILAAVDDGRRLVHEINAVALEDPMIEQVVQTALNGRVTAEEDFYGEADVPLRLIPASRENAAVPLMDFLFGDWQNLSFGSYCDRCLEPQPRNRLLIPAGASVVLLDLCQHCRWRLDPDRCLVWQ